jgi:phosphoesterase RecJ-like protein
MTEPKTGSRLLEDNKMSPIMPTELAELIAAGTKFIVVSHVQPDGDALGAVLGLTHLLRRLGKVVVASVHADQLPDKYSFLPGSDLLVEPQDFDCDTFIALDVANASRLGENKRAMESAKATINIDHHPDNSAFAILNWVDPEAASSSEMVFELWEAFGLTPTIEAAVCIYTGMMTDTGNWQYSNTTGKTLRIASALVDIGVEPNSVYRSVYESNTTGWLRLMGLGLSGAVVDPEHRLAYAVVTQADIETAGAKSIEAENIVDCLRSLAVVDVALVIKETKSGEFKGSIRSNGTVDVGELARMNFEGGGHHNAAGFTSVISPFLIIGKIKKWLAERGSDS